MKKIAILFIVTFLALHSLCGCNDVPVLPLEENRQEMADIQKLTAGPTAEPTVGPTIEPTAGPTAEPTAGPTAEPTAGPTAEPTVGPTIEPTAGSTAKPTAKPTSEPTVKPEFKPDSVLKSARVVVDGVVRLCDIQVKEESWYLSAGDAETVFGKTFEDVVELDAYAQAADIRYVQDNILQAAYFSTFRTYMENPNDSDFERAIALGLVPEDVRERRNEQIHTTEMRAMLVHLIKQLAPEQMAYFDENVTAYDEPMMRGTGFIMAFYAAQCIGADYVNNSNEHRNVFVDDFFDSEADWYTEIYPKAGDGPVRIGAKGAADSDKMEWENTMRAAFVWVWWHTSPVSGEPVFSLCEDGLFHQTAGLTVEAAVAAVTRLYDSVAGELVPVMEERVLVPSSAYFTEAVKAKMAAAPEVTAEEHPAWTGFSISSDYAKMLKDESATIQQIADWGFNSVRLHVDYEALFNYDATQVSLSALEVLDKQVVTAINNHLHLDICLTSVPGRTDIIHLDYTSEGDFDLFLNPAKQEMANRVYKVLAERYKDVPSAYLSFAPLFEPECKNKNTGLPYEDYTMTDVANYAKDIVELFRRIDPDRMLVFALPAEDDSVTEFLSVMGEQKNVLYEGVLGENCYIYTNMIGTEGGHLDTVNHSFFLADYPLYLYALSPFLVDMDTHAWVADPFPVDPDGEETDLLTLEGLLPAGTELILYVQKSFGGTLRVTADGETILEEQLEDKFYEWGEAQFVYMPYAETCKSICVTLPKETDLLELSVEEGGFIWGGIQLVLPEEYAVEKWYLATAYDVAQGIEEEEGVARKTTHTVLLSPHADIDAGRHVVILDDMTYTTDAVYMEASADSIEEKVELLAQETPGAFNRFTCGYGAKTEEGFLAYYTDILTSMKKNGINWWCDDMNTLCARAQIAEAEYVPYGSRRLYIKQLQLLQQYQSFDALR